MNSARNLMRNRRAARGMTVFEAIIATAILSTLLGGLFTFLVSARDHFESVSIESDLRDKVRIVMEFICNELRQASAASIQVDGSPSTLGGSKISYQKATGYANGALQLGPVQTLEWVLAPTQAIPGEGVEAVRNQGYIKYNDGTGDLDLADNCSEFLEGEVIDSIDNNGNGLTDEKGLCFARKTDASDHIVEEVIIRLTLVKVDRFGRVIYETSAEAAVTFRNP